MKRSLKAIGLLFLLYTAGVTTSFLASCAGEVSAARLPIIASDSLALTGKWSRVLDAKGLPCTYRVQFVRTRYGQTTDSVYWSGVVTDTLAVYKTLAPLAGDSAEWFIRVKSFDSRGDSSAVSVSARVKIKTSWTPPAPAQNVRLDTARISWADSVDMFMIRADGDATYGPFVVRVGETRPFA